MSDQITKDLGGITAYAAAVAAGYTGTKAQFETLMASYATVAQNAAASASAAADSEENAEAWAVGERGGTPVSSGDDTYNNSAKYWAEQAEDFADSIDPDKIESHIDAAYIKETASGSIATFSYGAPAPVRDLLVEIVPIQSGSGDPSPDNVRAISGWTECNVEVIGRNLLPKPDLQYCVLNGLTMEVADDGTITLNGTASGVNYVRGKLDMPLPIGDYAFESFNDTVNDHIYPTLRGSNYSTSAGGWHTLNGVSSWYPFTSTADAYYWQYQIDNGVSLSNFSFKPMLSFSKTRPTTFEPYNGNTTVHTISFATADTVYGGRLDVTRGVLTVDTGFIDLGQPQWYALSGFTDIFYTYDVTNVKPISNGNLSNAICSAYKTVKGNRMGYEDKSICVGMNNASQIMVQDSAYSSPSDFKVGANGVKLAYPLTTPQTYQLTPTEVKTLLKNNNVWADTGDVTVEYVADTKTFIEELINA